MSSYKSPSFTAALGSCRGRHVHFGSGNRSSTTTAQLHRDLHCGSRRQRSPSCVERFLEQYTEWFGYGELRDSLHEVQG